MGLTPLEPAPPGLVPGREVWLKREDVHELLRRTLDEPASFPNQE